MVSMFVLGVVGGVASGKSAVALEFERLGARRLDADALGHVALADGEVIAALHARWGDAVFTPEGAVARVPLAALVFGDSPEHAENLRYLEGLTHPIIRRLATEQLARWQRDGAEIVVVDAALLFEAGWDAWCDAVVYVSARDDVRRERALRRGWSADELRRRELRQLSLDEKRRRSTFVIDNSGPWSETQASAQQIWRQLGLRAADGRAAHVPM